MNTIAKFTAGAMSLALTAALVVGAVGVNAADVDQTNSETGNNSTNRNRVNIKVRHRTESLTNARAKNKLEVNANTGGNESNKNTTGGSVDSGNVGVTGDFVNDLNGGTENGDVVEESTGDSVPATISQDNTTTGNNSTNTNRVKIRESYSSYTERNASARNKVEVNANTGENESNKNTDGGEVDTGDVTVDLGITNILN